MSATTTMVHRTTTLSVIAACLCLIEPVHGLQQKGFETDAQLWNPFAAITGSGSTKEVEESNATSEPANVSANATNVIDISMYYEAMCPYCKIIIAGSLAQLWNDTEFHERINVSLVPYGNARTMETDSVSEGYRYWHQELQTPGFDHVYACQHGTDECFGNMLHACSIEHLGNESISFIMCMESYEDASSEMSSYLCAEALAVDLDPVRECVQGKEGNQVMMAKGMATETLAKPAGPREYVPWVVVDGKHCPACDEDGEEDTGKKASNLLTQVCGLLTEPKPALCTGDGGNFREVLSRGGKHHSLQKNNHSKQKNQTQKHSMPAELSRI